MFDKAFDKVFNKVFDRTFNKWFDIKVRRKDFHKKFDQKFDKIICQTKKFEKVLINFKYTLKYTSIAIYCFSLA